MTISELNKKYTKGELTSTEGDKELRYILFSPLFQNLFENKVVYHERFTCIVQLSDLVLTPDGFDAKAQRQLIIRKGSYENRTIPEVWSVGASWAFLRLIGDCLAPYPSWLMWTNPILVEKVENLVRSNKMDEAYKLTMGKMEF